MAFTLTANTGTSTTALGTCTSGNLMVVGMFNFSGSVTLTAATDSLGTTKDGSTAGYNIFTVAAGGNGYALIWGILIASGTNTLTATWTSGSTSAAGHGEFTGTSISGATPDGTGQSASGNSASTSTPNITTTGSDDLVLNYIGRPSSSGAPTFAGGWSSVLTNANGGLAYQADVGAATYSPSATFTTGLWASLCVAIKASGGAAAGPIFIPRRMPLGV